MGLAAINRIWAAGMVTDGVKEKVAVEDGFTIKAACIDSVTIEQFTREVTEAELKICL